MNKKIITALIIFCIILFIILVTSVFIIIKDKKDNDFIGGTNSSNDNSDYNNANINYSNTNNRIDNNNLSTNNNTNNSANNNSSVNQDTIKRDAILSSIEANGTDSNFKDFDELIKNIKISLANVNKEIQDRIKDRDKFIYTIKKRLYEESILDGDTLTMTNYTV